MMSADAVGYVEQHGMEKACNESLSHQRFVSGTLIVNNHFAESVLISQLHYVDKNENQRSVNALSVDSFRRVASNAPHVARAGSF